RRLTVESEASGRFAPAELRLVVYRAWPRRGQLVGQLDPGVRIAGEAAAWRRQLDTGSGTTSHWPGAVRRDKNARLHVLACRGSGRCTIAGQSVQQHHGTCGKSAR